MVVRCAEVVLAVDRETVGSMTLPPAALLQDYSDDINIDGALKLAMKVLSKSMDSTTLNSEKGTPPPLASWTAHIHVTDTARS